MERSRDGAEVEELWGTRGSRNKVVEAGGRIRADKGRRPQNPR